MWNTAKTTAAQFGNSCRGLIQPGGIDQCRGLIIGNDTDPMLLFVEHCSDGGNQGCFARAEKSAGKDNCSWQQLEGSG